MHKIVNGIKIEMTPEEILAREIESAQFQAEAHKVRYRKKRVAAYPTTGDQLDVLWKVVAKLVTADKDLVPDEAKAMLAKIVDIKETHPKP